MNNITNKGEKYMNVLANVLAWPMVGQEFIQWVLFEFMTGNVPPIVIGTCIFVAMGLFVFAIVAIASAIIDKNK
jgi:hypothetical protein